MNKPKIIRITTVPMSLKILLKGQLRFMSQYFEVIGVASSGADLEEVERKESIQVVPVEMSRQITPIKDLISLFNLYELLKKEKPFIVHTHTPKAGIIGMLAARWAKVPHRLHTVAGLPLMEATGMKRKILNTVEKATYASATKVYPNSKGLYDFIVQQKYTAISKLKIIGEGSSNGINTIFFSQEQIRVEEILILKKQLKIHAEDFVFIFVGRLVKDKGVNELIAAYSKLKTQNTKLILVGPFENELDPLDSKTLNEIANNRNIIAVGFQQDVRPYFAISNALVFPSYREGFPNVVMQAGAMGLPSIVSDINGCNEIIIEGKNGVIVPVKNTNAIYDAMNKLITNTEFRKQLQLNARPMIVSRYEQQLVWEGILEEYIKLVNNV